MINRCEKAVHWSAGSILFKSRSILSGLVLRVSLKRLARRLQWVSTIIPGKPKACPSITFAVFRPTPANVTNSSIVAGIWPWNFSTSWRAQVVSDFAFARNRPKVRIRLSISSVGDCANSAAVGKRRKSSGVTLFTAASVHCAERMTATRS